MFYFGLDRILVTVCILLADLAGVHLSRPVRLPENVTCLPSKSGSLRARHLTPDLLQLSRSSLQENRHNGPRVPVQASVRIIQMALSYKGTTTLPAPGLLFCKAAWALTSVGFSGWMYCIINYTFFSVRVRIGSPWSHQDRSKHKHPAIWAPRCWAATCKRSPLSRRTEHRFRQILEISRKHPPLCLSQKTFEPAEGARQVTAVVISYLRSHLYFISIRANPL